MTKLKKYVIINTSKEREEMQMTTVVYEIGTERTASYSKALELRETLNKPLKTIYIPISGNRPLSDKDKELRDKRWAKIRGMA